MSIINRTFCYNCFQERDSLDGPCPHCGFDLAENEKKYPVALRAGTVLNDRYIVGRVLGQGGFGITYLAWDTQLEAKVAIKEFMPNEIATRIGTTVSVAVESRSEDFTYGSERFQEEARTLAKFIGNPNIAAVTSYFDENDTSYFVMDYIEGISFKTYIANHGGKVSVEDTLNVMIPVLRALTAVHQEGFIHRDVTPDNIYITKDGMVKLLDFGSARYSIGDKSKSLDVILKVGYAPKEQYIRRSRQGPFTDVYSCAACFYAALTGFLPPEALERLDHDELVPVSQCGVDIPEYLDKAILKGLAVQPEDRFQSAEEFLEAIENQQVVEVPQAGAAQPAVPAKKKLSPVLIGGVAAAVVVVLGIGIAIGGNSGGSGGEASGGNSIAEALAPTVTIGGEEYSTALEELDLSYQDLTDSDIQGLSEMTNLKKLNLDGNQLSDLTALAGVTQLQSLSLGENGAVTDLSPLSGMVELVNLTLPANAEISDLSPLAGMQQLRSLNMSSGLGESLSLIEDISPLSELSHLESLTLAVRSLNDLSSLSGLTNLRELRLFGAISISDLSPLSGMSNLEILELPSNEANAYLGTDLNALENLHHLKEIHFNMDGLEDLAPLANLTELEELDIYGFEASYDSLEPLRNLAKLRVLVLPRRLASANQQDWCSLEVVAQFPDLQEARLDGDVSDLSPFRSLKNLRSLTLYNGYLMTDLSPLSELPNLQTLTIYGHSEQLDYSSLDHVPILNLD